MSIRSQPIHRMQKKKKKKSFLNKEKFTLKEEKIGKNMPENDQ